MVGQQFFECDSLPGRVDFRHPVLRQDVGWRARPLELSLLDQHGRDRGGHALRIGTDVKQIIDGDAFGTPAAANTRDANRRHAISLDNRRCHARQFELLPAGGKQRR